MKLVERDYLIGKVGFNLFVVVKVVYKVIRVKRFKIRYCMGILSFIVLIVRKILFDKWLDYILLKR